MEHNDARDGGSDLHAIRLHCGLVLILGLKIGRVSVDESLHRFIAAFLKKNDEKREADENGKLEDDLAAVAQENFPTSGQQSGKLA